MHVLCYTFSLLATSFRYMAFKIVKYWRSISENVNVINGLFRSSPPKVVSVPHLIAHHVQHQGRIMKGGARRVKLLELLPLMGIVFGAVGMGIHTAYHQLVHSPAVKISKQNRSSLWEVDRPDHIIHSGDKFINRSFFRKFGQIHKRVFSDSSSSQRNHVYTTSSYISTTASTTTTDKLVN